jgi:undecaprenyl-diphosphatase
MNLLLTSHWALLQVSEPDTVEQMTVFQAIVIGIVQGFTEFLPISSTAFVKIIPVVLGWGDPGVTFTAVVQLGSIAAILWYFWDDLKQVTLNMVQAVKRKDYASSDFRVGLGIFLGTIPIVVGGLLIKAFVPDFDNSPLRYSSTIAQVSIIMAVLLAGSELFGKRKRNFNDLDLRDGIGMGFAQALAIVPGVSRSGSTLTAGLFMGLDRSAAARFSFLLGIPAITLAGVVELKDLLDVGLGTVGWVPLLVGTLVSAIASYVAIEWLLRFLKQRSTWVFVWFRLAFGIAVLTAIATGRMENI